MATRTLVEHAPKTAAPPSEPGLAAVQVKRALVSSAALLTFAVAAIHLAVAPAHGAEYPPHGVFFVLLGVSQAALAVAMCVAPGRRLFTGAALGTLAVIGLWFSSRTSGLPVGPSPWVPEPIGFTDVLATLLEAITALMFIRLAWVLRRRKPRGIVRTSVATIPAGLTAALAGWLGVGAALSAMPEAVSAAPEAAGSSAVSVTSLVAARGSEPLEAFTLTASPARIAGQEVWTYNGSLPGPELRVTQGDRVRVTLVNRLTVATSIHWHGLRLPNAADGVSGVTQDAIAPGSSYSYEFVATDPGTYWYHSHQDPVSQIPRGLLGALVVVPRGGVVEARDYTLMVQGLPDSGTPVVNGQANLRLAAAPGESVRLRLINAVQPGFDGTPEMPALVGAPYAVAALDGHDLNQPQLLGPQRVPLGMGQRADLVFTMPARGSVRLAGLTGTPSLFGSPTTTSVTIGDGPPPPAVSLRSLPVFDVTKYGRPAADAVADAGSYDSPRRIVLSGAPQFRNGGFDMTFTLNGVASPHIPPINVREGQVARLRIVNEGDEPHPIHIHGHVFSVLARNGVALSGTPVHLDTVLVWPKETWDVAFKADNPGVWMLHCHILTHAAGGMSMTVNYDGVWSPFTMGGRSRNVPE
jgi:FtsP/CotA-like multicopper oxidase with cupredoxin domain